MRHFLTALSEIDRLLDDGGRLLIATDFDGTLCELGDIPADVHLASSMLDSLRRLHACNLVTMVVISGRALSDLHRRLPLDIIMAGNHGLEITGGGMNFEHNGARQLRFAITGACEALTRLHWRWPAIWIEDKEFSATLHFRKVDQNHHGRLLFDARSCLAAFGPHLALRVGKQALEIRPNVKWNKGDALQYIRGGIGPFRATICMGDGRTDESMFRANPKGVNIRIGHSVHSAANEYLANPDEVAILLAYMAASVSIERSAAAEPGVRCTAPAFSKERAAGASHDRG